jgi:hypothetical protein
MSEPSLLTHADGVYALYKPCGWVVHAAMARETHDVRAWCAKQPNLPKGMDPCHRLDRDTSGVVLFAADPEVRARVGGAFMAGTVRKTYLALVFGKAHQKGVIRRALSQDRPGPPQAAVSRYRLDEALGGFSLLRVAPETGRKHQVRRHLQSIGHPVVGDDRYGPKRFRAVPGYPGRLWLHAFRIELPGGVVFEAPLPAELQQHLELLRLGAHAATARREEAEEAGTALEEELLAGLPPEGSDDAGDED